MAGGNQVLRDRGHGFEVERFHGVGVLVVVWIPEEGGVGEHDCGEALVPIAEVVGESHLGHDKGKGGNRMLGECVIEEGEERSRLLVAHDGDVVADSRIDAPRAGEGKRFLGHAIERGQLLRAGFVRVIPEAFEADHALEVVTVFPAGCGVDAAAHRLVKEMGRLFVRVGDKADVSLGTLRLSEEAGGFEKDGHGGGIVIRSRGAGRGVVVGTENPVGSVQPAKIARHGFDVVAIDALDAE